MLTISYTVSDYIRFYVRFQNCEKRLQTSSFLSVHRQGKIRFSLEGLSRNLTFEYFFEIFFTKFKFH